MRGRIITAAARILCMKKRAISLIPLALAALFAAARPALADPDEKAPSPEQQAWQQRLEKAAELKNEGAARKAEAQRVREQAYIACNKQFFVNACRHDAHQAFVTTQREGLRIENEGKAMERLVHQEQLVAKDQQRALETPQKTADLDARAAELEAERTARESEREAKLADKARKAEAGAQRKAEDEASLQRRQAEHAARVAEKMRAAEEKKRREAAR